MDLIKQSNNSTFIASNVHRALPFSCSCTDAHFLSLSLLYKYNMRTMTVALLFSTFITLFTSAVPHHGHPSRTPQCEIKNATLSLPANQTAITLPTDAVPAYI